MTDLCELQLERGALVLRGFDDLLASHAELVPANDAGRRRERSQWRGGLAREALLLDLDLRGHQPVSFLGDGAAWCSVST